MTERQRHQPCVVRSERDVGRRAGRAVQVARRTVHHRLGRSGGAGGEHHGGGAVNGDSQRGGRCCGRGCRRGAPLYRAGSCQQPFPLTRRGARRQQHRQSAGREDGEQRAGPVYRIEFRRQRDAVVRRQPVSNQGGGGAGRAVRVIPVADGPASPSQRGGRPVAPCERREVESAPGSDRFERRVGGSGQRRSSCRAGCRSRRTGPAGDRHVVTGGTFRSAATAAPPRSSSACSSSTWAVFPSSGFSAGPARVVRSRAPRRSAGTSARSGSAAGQRAPPGAGRLQQHRGQQHAGEHASQILGPGEAVAEADRQGALAGLFVGSRGRAGCSLPGWRSPGDPAPGRRRAPAGAASVPAGSRPRPPPPGRRTPAPAGRRVRDNRAAADRRCNSRRQRCRPPATAPAATRPVLRPMPRGQPRRQTSPARR